MFYLENLHSFKKLALLLTFLGLLVSVSCQNKKNELNEKNAKKFIKGALNGINRLSPEQISKEAKKLGEEIDPKSIKNLQKKAKNYLENYTR